MNEVFTFPENEIYELRSGIHLAKKNMHTKHHGTDIISSLRLKIKKLIPDKIKASPLAVFQSKVKSWSIGNCPCRLCKVLVQDLGFAEVCLSV